MPDCELTIELEDKPGELAKILEIIAKNNGNLFSVSHLREKEIGKNIPVVIKFQSDEKGFKAIEADLIAQKIKIIKKKSGDDEETNLVLDFIILGHVIDTNIKDTIYSVSDSSTMVRRLNIAIRSIEDPSAVFIQLSAKGRDALEKGVKKLKKVCMEKNLLMVPQIATD